MPELKLDASIKNNVIVVNVIFFNPLKAAPHNKTSFTISHFVFLSFCETNAFNTGESFFRCLMSSEVYVISKE